MDSEGEHCKGENYEIKNEPYVDCEGDDCEGEHCEGEKMNLMWIVKVMST